MLPSFLILFSNLAIIGYGIFSKNLLTEFEISKNRRSRNLTPVRAIMILYPHFPHLLPALCKIRYLGRTQCCWELVCLHKIRRRIS